MLLCQRRITIINKTHTEQQFADEAMFENVFPCAHTHAHIMGWAVNVSTGTDTPIAFRPHPHFNN